ncbi:MAG: hypothetical protein AB7O24_25910 [Kofleriaceae bacterium]
MMVVAVGCQSGSELDGTPVDEGGAEASAGEPMTVAVQPERALASLIDRTHFAFRTSGGRFLAQHTTHTVTVDHGVIAMTPYHRENNRVRSGAPITLETVGLIRGADDYAIDPVSTRVSETGKLIVDRGNHVETVRNFESGIEQSWTFLEPPVGEGEMIVKIAVVDQPFISSTTSGLHFGRAGELGFRYGHATWIDANGVATPVEAKWQNKQIELMVPEDILENSAYPAVLDPTVNAEVAIDNPVAGWSGASALRSSIASDGTGYLAVWLDARNPTADIFGARLDASGNPLDATGLAINTESDAADNPAVAFANGSYVVVWDNGTSVRGTTVSTAGAVGAASTIGTGVEPEVASGGSSALVAFRTGGDVNASLFNGSFGAPVSIAAGVAATTPAVGGGSSGYLVTWTEATNLRGRFVSSAGAPGAAAFDVNASAGSQLDGAVGFNGTNFVVVWSNNSGGINIDAATVTPAGVVTPVPTGQGSRISGAPNNQFQPSIACNTSGSCFAAWSDRQNFATNVNDVYGATVTGSPPVGTPAAVASGVDEQRDPSVAVAGSSFRVSYEDTSHGGTSTILTVPSTGGAGVNATRGNNQEERPASTGSPTQFLVSWADSRAVGHDIYGGRVSAAGAALDPTGVAISTAARTQYNPASTFDGTNFDTVWQDNRSGNQDIYFARTSSAGALLDGSGIAISTASGDQTLPDIAYGNNVNLVVWQDGRAGSNFDLYGALVTPSGSVTLNDIAICTNSANQRAPVAAYDAANNLFLVAWYDNTTGSDRVYVARVTTAGTVLDNCGLLITSAANVQNTPAIASGNGTFFVSWTSGPDNSGDVLGARVNATTSNLSVLDSGLGIATGNGITQRESSVAFVGGAFTVVYQQAGDIFGRMVKLDGTFDGAAFTVSANPETETRPSISAGGGTNNALVSFERDIVSANATRIVTRRLDYTPTMGGTAIPCNSNTQCASGFCVDNYCCDTACGGNSTTDCQACSVAHGGAVNGTCTVISLARNWRCRTYADTFCDLIEVCSGASAACPPDLGRRQGVACTIAGGGAGVCPLNSAAGAPHVCQ